MRYLSRPLGCIVALSSLATAVVIFAQEKKETPPGKGDKKEK